MSPAIYMGSFTEAVMTAYGSGEVGFGVDAEESALLAEAFASAEPVFAAGATIGDVEMTAYAEGTILFSIGHFVSSEAYASGSVDFSVEETVSPFEAQAYASGTVSMGVAVTAGAVFGEASASGSVEFVVGSVADKVATVHGSELTGFGIGLLADKLATVHASGDPAFSLDARQSTEAYGSGEPAFSLSESVEMGATASAAGTPAFSVAETVGAVEASAAGSATPAFSVDETTGAMSAEATGSGSPAFSIAESYLGEKPFSAIAASLDGDASVLNNGTAHEIRLYTAATGGSELSGSGYSRQSSAFTGSDTQTNDSEIYFPEATADWGTCYVRVYTSAGVLLAHTNTGVSVGRGFRLRIPATQYEVSSA